MRAGAALQAAGERDDWNETFPVECDDCGAQIFVSKFASDKNGYLCAICEVLQDLVEEELLWEGLEEPEDFVRCRKCGIRGQNLTSHVQKAHPELIGRYSTVYPGALIMALGCPNRLPSGRLNFTRADLLPYADKKGRVIVAQAADELGCSWLTVLRYCRKLGIPTRNRLAKQKWVLDLVSKILDEPYVWECHGSLSVDCLSLQGSDDGESDKPSCS